MSVVRTPQTAFDMPLQLVTCAFQTQLKFQKLAE